MSASPATSTRHRRDSLGRRGQAPLRELLHRTGRRPRIGSIATLLCCIAIGGPSAAQDEDPLDGLIDIPNEISVRPPMAPETAPPKAPEPEAFGSPSWNVPTLRPREFDWIKLTNGEWLKGEIDVMRSDRLEFNSDELDELTIDWEKIASLHTARPYTFGFSRRRQATGRALITVENVIVQTDSGEEVYDRKDLYSIVHAQQSWWSLWQGKISVGATVRAGNTDQIDAFFKANIKRRTAFSRFSLDARANYGTIDDEATVQNTKTDLSFDIFITDRFFVTPAAIELYRDKFQNIELRYSPGAGVGYELFDNKMLEMNIQSGAVYRATNFISVEAGEDEIDRTGALTAATDWEATLTPRVDLDGSYSASIGIPDAKDTNQHADVVLSVEITGIVDLDVTFVWDRVGDPVAFESDEIPEQDDFTLSVGLGIDF